METTLRIGMALVLAVGLNACAARKPAFPTYRLVQAGSAQVLIPPGAPRADSLPRTFTADVATGSAACPSSAAIGLRKRKNRVTVTVNASALAAQPAGWLGSWTQSLEAQGCLAAGEGWSLANQIVQSVALDPGDAFALLHPNLVDFVPGIEIQINSPVMRAGTPPGTSPLETTSVSQSGTGLDVEVTASAALLGYETDRYAVRARAGVPGVEIVALSAEWHVHGQTEALPQPPVNFLHFSAEARFFRLFYKEAESRFTALIVAAPSPGELERRIGSGADPASCETFGNDWCVAIPRLAAFNLVVPAQVNGKPMQVRYGATLAELLRGAGEPRPQSVPPTLTVLRNFHGRPVTVEFDRGSTAILGVIVTGGEIVS